MKQQLCQVETHINEENTICSIKHKLWLLLRKTICQVFLISKEKLEYFSLELLCVERQSL